MQHASAQFDTPSAARLHTPDFEASPTKIPNEAIFSANPYQLQPLVPFGYEPSAPPTPGVLPSWEFPPLRISHSFRTRSPRHCIH
jgi:hypothetical protein